MMLELALAGLALLSRLIGAALRAERAPLFRRLAGWTGAAMAVWFALAAANAWSPLWPALLVGLMGGWLAPVHRRWPAILLADALVVLATGLLSLPPLETAVLLPALLLVPAAGLAIDALVARLLPAGAWKPILAGGALLGLLVLAIPSVRSSGLRFLASRLPDIDWSAVALTRSQQADSRLQFSDITETAGTGGPTAKNETGGHGVMWADADDDGRPDLYITMNWNQPMADLYFGNEGDGRFEDRGADAGIDDFDGGSHGACFADLDNDGDYDLFNGTTADLDGEPGGNDLFRNDGNGRFRDVTAEAGLAGAERWLTRAVLCLDVEGDGDLDLFAVTNYQGSADPAGERNELFLNDGDWRFSPAPNGDHADAPAGQGAIDTDFDGDGDVDILAANRTGPLNVLRNDGRGRFTLVDPASLGINDRAGDGVTTGDIDNDGDLDLLLTGDGVGVLYRSDGDGYARIQRFEDTEGYMGGFADLDNDGDLDLVFAGDDRVYLNDGSGRFRAGPSLPVAGIDDPRAVAFADIDDDGDLDFAIGAKRSRNWLVRNDAAGGEWLKVELISPAGGRGAFGAKVFAYDGDGRLLGLREARSNGGYLAQDDPLLHFGLGEVTVVDLEIHFLDGTVVTRRDVAAGQTVIIDGAADEAALVGRQWSPYLEWRLPNDSYQGNPFDLLATAIFRHEASGETRTTGMFYDGEDGWRFRLAATQPGLWTFTTQSDDPELDGRSGSATIRPNPTANGFVTAFGDQWGWSATGRAFVPQLVMVAGPQAFYEDATAVDDVVQTFLVEHGFNGVHTPVFCRWFDVTEQQCSRINAADPNPDPRTFEGLEALISRVYAAGGMTHIWAWGDDSRGENPKRWGLNGTADQRLQRYIAARLGPLPGWTMGYGYDLHEWVEGDELTGWHDYLQAHLGWPHLLGARAGKNKLNQLSEAMEYAAYEQHKPTYEIYVETIEARPDRPAFSEDRFRLRDEGRDKDYTMEETRRGLWRSAMAGGVANIWGNLLGAPGANTGAATSAPYPNPEWVRTYADFFDGRFLRDMIRCNEQTDGVCLMGPTGGQMIIYSEDVASIRLDLSEVDGARTAVAVDARRPYEEIALGALDASEQVWQAPYRSDWAIAVGDFSAATPVAVQPPGCNK